jgi:hypothetical protein
MIVSRYVRLDPAEEGGLLSGNPGRTDLGVKRHTLHVLDKVAADCFGQDVVGPDDVRSQDTDAVGGERLAVEVKGAGAIVGGGGPLGELSSASAVKERLG